MRELTSHKVNGLNESIGILVMDQPGPGNACHEYIVDLVSPPGGPGIASPSRFTVKFQNGPIQEAGVNGISNESLLAIVEDRLLGFQSGPYACPENEIALRKLQEAMMWLQKRTRDRVARGVEGTSVK